MHNTENTKLQADTVFTDAKIFAYLRDFVLASKPDAEPSDIQILTTLLMFKTIDHDGFFSNQKLATMNGLGLSTVKRAIARLKKLKWITRTPRRGRPALISVNLENLPTVDKTLPKVASEAAKQLAESYITIVRQIRVKFPRDFLTKAGKPMRKFSRTVCQEQWNAENILRHCKGNVTLAYGLVNHAFRTPEFKKIVTCSLYKVFQQITKIEMSYQTAVQNTGKGVNQ